MPTIIGVIFFFCGLYCFLCREENLLGLLLISTVFEAASAVNIGERGIQPYYIVAAFIIARGFVNRMLGVRSSRSMPQSKWLLTFGAITVMSSFVFPFVFAGIPILDPKVGIDASGFIRPALAFNLNNVVQSVYLTWHIVTAFALFAIKFSARKARKAFMWAFYIEVFFVFAESFCQLAGINFPLSLVLNNPGYALWENVQEVYGTRNPGTFSEPSIAGAFLLLYCVGFLAQYLAGQRKAIKMTVSLIASGMVASSASLVTLALFPFVLIVRYSPFRFPWYVNLRKAKRIALILAILIVPLILVLLFSSGYRTLLATLTLSKGESGSFINRTSADLYGLQLLTRTYGMGVGLGGSRSSSLITTLLSNIGIAGTLAFLIFFFKVLASLPEVYTWLKWGILALFVNMCIGIADVTMPLLWCPIFLALQLSSDKTAANPNAIDGRVRREKALQPT